MSDSLVTEAIQTCMEHWRGWPLWAEVVDEVVDLADCDRETAEEHMGHAVLTGEVIPRFIGRAGRAMTFTVHLPHPHEEAP